MGESVSPGGRVLDSVSAFLLVSPGGKVMKVYDAPWISSVEDTLYFGPIHRVVDGQLVVSHWKDVFDRDQPETFGEQVLLTGLAAVSSKTLPFDPDAVIAAYEARRM
jgi:hypothetical protein